MFTQDQKKQLAQLGILNLAEVCHFVSVSIDGLNNTLSDGKISIFEGISLALKVSPEAREAFKDIDKVLTEVKVLDAQRFEVLAELLYPTLFHTLEGKPYTQELVNRVLGIATQVVHLVQLLRDKENWINPPAAKVVE